MPYIKPGVEIIQLEKSQSPVLIAPELEVMILGTAYHYQDPFTDAAKSSTKLIISSTTGGQDSTFNIGALGYTVSAETQLIVDLVCTKGANIGRRFHADADDYSITSNIVTVSKTANGVAYDTSVVFSDNDEFDVYVGFVAEKTSANMALRHESLSDIEEYLGKLKTFNPLGYGAYTAMRNSGTQINTYGHTASALSSSVLTELDLHDVYSIAGMDHDSSISDYKTHVNAQSTPELKHERLAFVNVARSSDIASGLTSTTRNTSAVTIQQANAAVGAKRVFSIHPDRGYVLEDRHVISLKPEWIIASFAGSAGTVIATGVNDKAKLASPVTTKTNVKYPAGTLLTSTILNDLMKSGWGEQGEVSVYVPVPGYYYAAAVAGAVVGTPIEQPLTYYTVSGVDRTYGSLDMFSETNLNTMAEGGTFIMVQDSPNSPIYIRHQLSTDVTTIERKELSITRQVDYASKYIRKTLTKYAGKYNITPRFLKLVEANLNGVGKELINSGKLAGFKVLSVYQDELSKDTVRASVELTVYYPGNYIKITVII